MDMLFVLIAVCPAAAAAGYECRRKTEGRRAFGIAFARWFYGITFANLGLMYARGWGSFDFTALSVVFLLKYMLSSVVVMVAAGVVKGMYSRFKKSQFWAAQSQRRGQSGS